MFGVQSLPLAMAAAYGFAFAESGLGLGMVIPGETAVVAISASVDGVVATTLVFVAVVGGACCGDQLGYWIGRTQGERVRGSRAVSRIGTQHWDRATHLLRRRGATAVFVTRLLPIVRTLTPAAAGASGLAYPRFLAASLSGSMLWAGVYVGGGRAAAHATRAAYDHFGNAAWWVAAAIGVLLLVALVWRRRPRSAHHPVALRAGAQPAHRADLASAPDRSLTGRLQP